MYLSLLLDTEHFQFYLEDLAVDHDTSHLWRSSAVDQRLDVLDGLIAIGTARWGQNTAITIETYDQSPVEKDFERWDWVIEASIRSISGQLHLTTPEGDEQQAPCIFLAPRTYRVRILYGDLDQISDDLAEEGPDKYQLVLWPGELSEPSILKAP